MTESIIIYHLLDCHLHHKLLRVCTTHLCSLLAEVLYHHHSKPQIAWKNGTIIQNCIQFCWNRADFPYQIYTFLRWCHIKIYNSTQIFLRVLAPNTFTNQVVVEKDSNSWLLQIIPFPGLTHKVGKTHTAAKTKLVMTTQIFFTSEHDKSNQEKN